MLAVLGLLAAQRALAPAAPPPSRQVATVQRATVTASVNASGSVVAVRQAKLSFRTGGVIAGIDVGVGDHVKAGQTLATLVPDSLQLRLDQARSSLRTAQLKLEQLERGARPEEIAAARAAFDAAAAQYGDLVAGATASDIAVAQATVESARAALRAAQLKYEDTKAGPTSAEITAARATVDTAQANLVAAEARLHTLREGPTAAESTAELARATLQNAVAKLDELRAGPTSDEIAAAQSTVDVAKASLTSAQAKLEELEAGPKESDVRIAETNVESAQAVLASALAKLAATTAAPRQGELGSALSSVESARRQLAALTPTELDLALSREAVVAAELALRQAELDLRNAAIVAPFDGIVSAVSGQVGEQASGQASASIGSVVLLVDPREVRVDVSVYEIDVAKVQPGKPATVTFDAFRDRTYPATVTAIAPSGVANQGVVTFQVSLSVDPARFNSSNTTGASTAAAAPGTSRGAPASGTGGGPNAAVGAQPQVLPAGLTASVVIAIAQKEGVLAVSRRAIKTEGADKTVEVLRPDGTTETRVVKTGLVGDQLTEITDGLAEGEQVVVPTTTTRAPSVGGAPGLFSGPPSGPPPGPPPM